MKRIKLGLLLSMIGTCLLAGCVQSHRAVMTPTGRTVVVKESPPPPRQEIQTTAPSPAHVWVPGYWAYTGNRWAWVPGHWETRPRAAAVWTPGHWDRDATGRGWVWTPGHWE